MKLTASKMSCAALASDDSRKRISWEGRGDAGALVGCTLVFGAARVGAGRVGCAMVGVDRVGFARGGVGTGKGTGSCKSGKGESKDDFELHVVVV